MSVGGFSPRPGWGFVLVEGPDAWSFLQSLVSQDLDPLADGDGCHSLLLSPQGKLDADFRLLRVGDAAWLDGRDGPALAQALTRFKIRVDAEVADRSDAWAMLSARGVDAGALGVALPPDEHAHLAVDGARVVRATWGDRPGFDVLGPAEAVAGVEERLVGAGVARLDDATFERLRIEAGVPLQGVDMDASTIPQEALLERDAIAFAKGCFLGQELVARIDARGRVTRLLRRISIPDDVPAAGTELHDTDGKAVGALTSVVDHPDGGAVALAMVRHEIEPPAELALAGGGTVSVEAIRS